MITYGQFKNMVERYTDSELEIILVNGTVMPPVLYPDSEIMSIKFKIVDTKTLINLTNINHNSEESVEELIRRKITSPKHLDSILVYYITNSEYVESGAYATVFVPVKNPIVIQYTPNRVEVIVWRQGMCRPLAYEINEYGTLEERVPGSWVNGIQTLHDFYKNPNNEHLQDTIQFADVASDYAGNNILVYGEDTWYIRVHKAWMPTNCSWVKAYLHLFSAEVQEEYKMVYQFTEK
ncbi:hypothetical protein D3C78_19850 [compost metagenome]